jgi:hypothetical protein
MRGVRSPATRPTRPDRPPAWAVVSAVTAPVAMVGGWVLAEALEPGFDPVRRTISELATRDVAHPAVMTAGLLVTGAAHVVTAAGLRVVPRAGRVLLALGGVATAAVGLLPLDRAGAAHGVAAGVAFGALALWPAAATRRPAPAPPTAADPGVLRPAVTLPTSAALLGLLAWFVAEQAAVAGLGDRVGLAERAVAVAESVAPLLLVLGLALRPAPALSPARPRRRPWRPPGPA